MKKKLLVILALVFIFSIVIGTCSCFGSKSKSESESESSSVATGSAEVDTEVGNTENNSTNEIDADLSVSGVEIMGDTITQEAKFTFSELLWNLYRDPFISKTLKILLVTFVSVIISLVIGFYIILFGWLTGNLNPSEKFSLFKE